MEYCFCGLVAKEDLQGVYKTIHTFLEAQNFKETARVFQQECYLAGIQVGSKTSPSVAPGGESLENALKQVMSTLKKIEFSITHGQKEMDVPDVLEGINERLKQHKTKIEDSKDVERPLEIRNSKVEIDYHRLDFAKIKNDLLYSGVDNQVKLITALQLVIINKKDHRNFLLENISKYDLLCLKKMDGNLISFYMKKCNMSWMQETMARFVNTIASLRRGRDYLTANDTFIQVILFPNILRYNISITCQNMLIATLQKLSLRYASRNLMIRLGLLEFIVEFLEVVNENTPKYCLEYCSALLMNLCLENEGRNKCATMPKKIIAIMKKMLKGDLACCLPCVNGTLYSILVNKQVNNEAKLQRLDQLLQYLAKVTETTEDETIKKQTNIILWSRFGENFDSVPASIPHQELENEEEYLENELIEGINTKEHDIEIIFGKYMVNCKNGDEVQVNWMCRPATPASFKRSFNNIPLSKAPVEDFNCGDTDETPNERGMIECKEREYPKPNYELDTISCPSETKGGSSKKPMKGTGDTPAKITKSRKSFSECEYYTKLMPQMERCNHNMHGNLCNGCVRPNSKLKRRFYKMCL